MSYQGQQYIPPPPPPSPGFYATNGASFPPGRRPAPAQPPTITTNLVNVRSTDQQSPVPTSAATLGSGSPYRYSPGTPITLNSRPQSTLGLPGSQQSASPRSPRMEPYNPRQWSNSGQAVQMSYQQRGSTSSPMPRSTQTATGMEGA